MDKKAAKVEDAIPGVVVVKFADVEIPEFKEVRNKDYVLYGKSNLYPQYLTYLYNKSAKHSAIINGKSKYIFGGGFAGASIDELEKIPAINRDGETWNDVAKKAVKDAEIYGGYRLMVIWNTIGSKPADIFHIEFEKIRADKESGFWYKYNWADLREQAIHYPEFNPNERKGVQIFSYNEYRPGTNIYPLPEYLACNNYIETDIEISKFHLSSIRNGMMPSKAIEFFIGDPTDEKKRDIERSFSKKFSGAENAGKFVMIFNTSKDKSVNITDLSASELDKQFDLLNKTCQQEIFTGHQVTSPMLFGIKEEGQLGGSTELETAYQIFINTYAKPKQADLEKVVNYFQSLSQLPTDLYIKQLDPIGLIIPEALLASAITPDEVREKLGLPIIEKPTDSFAQKTINALASVSPLVATKILDNLNRNEIRGLAGLPPVIGGDIIPMQVGSIQPQQINSDGLGNEDTAVVNDSIKNLSAKQHQQLMRIIRQYSKDQITKEAASVLLKTGLGLSDEDINSLLGIEEEPISEVPVTLHQAFYKDDDIVAMFNACGDSKNDYHLIKSKKILFSSDEEVAIDELNFYKQSFKVDLSISEKDILSLIAKDSKITPEIISEALNTTPEYVTAKIAKLVNDGLLKSTPVQVGDDTQIDRELTKPLSDISDGNNGQDKQVVVSIKYSYEGPEDDRNRAFCAKLMSLNRFYSRFEIEQISQQLGYSVFDRRGGFWRHPDGITTPYCRHKWTSNIVVKKGRETA